MPPPGKRAAARLAVLLGPEGPPWAEPDFFDPLSTRQLTATICERFEEQALVRYDSQPPASFEGAGLYALYYVGDSVELYEPLRDYPIPVYVGSAQSHNSATGRLTAAPRPLHGRVKDHWKSINGAADLDVTEFGVRLLRLPDVHIDLGENGLRVNYTPVWNSVLNGFGSHEQGSSTRKSAKSAWDTVHGGRKRTFGDAEKHKADVLLRRAHELIASQVAAYRVRHGLT